MQKEGVSPGVGPEGVVVEAGEDEGGIHDPRNRHHVTDLHIMHPTLLHPHSSSFGLPGEGLLMTAETSETWETGSTSLPLPELKSKPMAPMLGREESLWQDAGGVPRLASD